MKRAKTPCYNFPVGVRKGHLRRAAPGSENRMVKMKYCVQCGTKLEEKYLLGEGMIPYCSACGEFRFPIFNTAVSMIVMNKSLDRVLLIRQYGKEGYILVAGYVNRGEDAEDAVAREIREEVGLHVLEMHFNRSHFFEPSNTLMLNYTAIVEDAPPQSNNEVDDWAWMTIEEARERIRPGSLAESFLTGFFDGFYTFS